MVRKQRRPEQNDQGVNVYVPTRRREAASVDRTTSARKAKSPIQAQQRNNRAISMASVDSNRNTSATRSATLRGFAVSRAARLNCGGGGQFIDSMVALLTNA